MKHRLAKQVCRVAVTDPVATARRYDYADAFEVRLREPDPHPTETWVLEGMEDVPAVIEWITSLLGFRDEPATSTDRVAGWLVVESNPEVVHLERSLPLMHVTVVGRRLGSSGRMLTTVLNFERPVLARLVWTLVGIAHRRTARQTITSQSPSADSGR